MSNKKQNMIDIQMLRVKAEKQLKERHKTIEDSSVETDMERLLNELRVHQIELEMQNEDLMEANETAEEALKKYTILYDFAPMGYFTLDHECIILDLNFTGAEMLGEKRFSLINSNFKLFISNDSLPVFNKFFSKIYVRNMKGSCKVNLGYNKKLLYPVYVEGVVTGEDQKCLLSMIDISELKK